MTSQLRFTLARLGGKMSKLRFLLLSKRYFHAFSLGAPDSGVNPFSENTPSHSPAPFNLESHGNSHQSRIEWKHAIRNTRNAHP
jgi:hypothetical protein